MSDYIFERAPRVEITLPGGKKIEVGTLDQASSTDDMLESN